MPIVLIASAAILAAFAIDRRAAAAAEISDDASRAFVMVAAILAGAYLARTL
jgi:hypothetical protein